MVWRVVIGGLALFTGAASGAEPSPAVFEYRAAIAIHGNGQRYTAAVPVPIEWPEQHIELISKRQKNGRARVETVDRAGAMLILTGDAVPKGDTAEVDYVYRVTISPVRFAVDESTLVAPSGRQIASLSPYLKPSPGIESRDDSIKSLATELTAGSRDDWHRVEALFRFVHDEIKYQEMDFTSAAAAVENRIGDCEEKASVFIAMCRSLGIPARTVWAPGHCWAEFYLLDTAGDGHWYPAHTSGEKWLGEMLRPQLIIQKGDNFRVSQRKGEAMRLLSPWLRGPHPIPEWEPVYEAREVTDQPADE